MNALLAPLVESPQSLQYIDELQELARAERARREQFYEDISPEDKWEFINGEVIMHSPTKLKRTVIVGRVSRLLNVHVATHRLGLLLTEKVMITLSRNDYEPDIVFFPEPLASTLDPEQWKFPAPMMIVEVLSASTRDRDLGIKFRDYAAHGVSEYWVIDPDAKSIEQYLLAGDTYPPVEPKTTGTVFCPSIAGFEMPVCAAFDDTANLET